MAAIQLLKSLFRPRATQPHAERSLLQHIRRHRILRIVEIGVGDVSRAISMIALAQKQAGDQVVDYTGIDMFDARGAHESRLSLKQAHRQLVATGAQVRLIPGDPYSTLSQFANRLPDRDLIVITAGEHVGALEKSWFYMPRMLGERASVWLYSQPTGQEHGSFECLSAHALNARAQAPKRRAA